MGRIDTEGIRTKLELGRDIAAQCLESLESQGSKHKIGAGLPRLKNLRLVRLRIFQSGVNRKEKI
jgi:hypothetical protein